MLRSPIPTELRGHASAWLIFASGTFWFSWLLAPAAGVSRLRPLLIAGYEMSVSEFIRLAALVAYAFGLGALLQGSYGKRKSSRVGAVFLLIGVIGTSLNLHLRLIRPELFMMMFFWGHLGLVLGFKRQTALAQLGLVALLLTPIMAALGWVAMRVGVVQPPIASLAVLGTVTSSLALSVRGSAG